MKKEIPFTFTIEQLKALIDMLENGEPPDHLDDERLQLLREMSDRFTDEVVKTRS